MHPRVDISFPVNITAKVASIRKNKTLNASIKSTEGLRWILILLISLRDITIRAQSMYTVWWVCICNWQAAGRIRFCWWMSARKRRTKLSRWGQKCEKVFGYLLIFDKQIYCADKRNSDCLTFFIVFGRNQVLNFTIVELARAGVSVENVLWLRISSAADTEMEQVSTQCASSKRKIVSETVRNP